MADYVLPSVVEKRVRFFDGQFLQDQDFIDEQDYQLDRERRHNRLLHGPGITEGLAVTSAAPNQATVAPGTAIDADGRQLVLAQATTVDLPAADFNDKQGVEVLIGYLESAEDPQTVGGSQDFTRWLERPALTALAPGETYSGATPPVLLAKVALDNSGRVAVDATVRSYAGLLLPGSGADAVTLRATSAGPVELAGSLTVDGSLGVGTTNPAAKLEVVGNGGGSIDLVVNGRLQSNNPDGGLWVSTDRFVGGFDGNKIGFYNTNAWHLAVLPNGNIGIGGNTSPGYPLHLPPGKALRIDGGVNSNDGAAYLSLGGNGAFSIDAPSVPGGRFVVSNSGAVGIGTANPGAKLTISANDTHLQVRSEKTAAAGTKIFLELFQDTDTSSQPLSPNPVYPCLRFHHSNVFWHRIEGRPEGLAFKGGDPNDQTLHNVIADTAVLNALQIGNATIGSNELAVLQQLAAGKLQLGNVTIGSNELGILQKLAAGTLQFFLFNVNYNGFVYADEAIDSSGTHRGVYTYARAGVPFGGSWQIKPD